MDRLLRRFTEPAVALTFTRCDLNLSDNHIARRGGTGETADVILTCGTLIVDPNRVQAK